MNVLAINPIYFLLVVPPGEDLRWILVSTLYALVLAEVAHQSVSLVARRCGWRDLSTGISHLLLVAALVTTSWVGWSVSIAHDPHAEHRVSGVFSLPYVVLLIDVGLLTAYFILARAAGIPKKKDEPIVASAKPESFWLMVVFGGYVLWDIVTHGALEGDFWPRAYPTIICFLLSCLAWRILRVVEKNQMAVVAADAGMLAFIFFFRAMKVAVFEKGSPWDLRSVALGGVFLIFLVAARLLNRNRTRPARAPAECETPPVRRSANQD